MRKLLILTPRFPYPVVGGDRLRIYHICRSLSTRYQLTLLSLCDSQDEMDMPLIDDGVFCHIERIYLPKWKSWLSCGFALLGKMPLQIAYYHHDGFRRRAIELMSENDGVLAHLIRVGDMIKGVRGVKFLEMTDVISLNYERIRSTRASKYDIRSKIFSFEVDRLRSYEESVVDHFEHSFLVSDIDRRHLFGSQSEKLSCVSVVSNGVELELLPYQFSPSGCDLVFIGNMYSLQNFDAAVYMSSEVLPLIRRIRPNVRLRLIGRIRPGQADKLAAYDGVDVIGEVPDVASAAKGGAVGVCPVRIGAGIQNKVLEYMALGLPTVSTSIGLEGFGARHERDLLVADQADCFAAAVLKVLNDRMLAEAMAKNARHYVETTHSWPARLESMLEIIDTRLSAGGGRRLSGFFFF